MALLFDKNLLMSGSFSVIRYGKNFLYAIKETKITTVNVNNLFSL